MSLEARQGLVASPLTLFQRDSQRSDLLDPSLTQTQLIALLIELVTKGYAIEFTAIRSDHHDDSALGLHCHANGYCADLWPLNTPTAGDYMDANDKRFGQFLFDASNSMWLYQIGLAGEADTLRNRGCAGRTVFEDDGGDHIHLGANGP